MRCGEAESCAPRTVRLTIILFHLYRLWASQEQPGMWYTGPAIHFFIILPFGLINN